MKSVIKPDFMIFVDDISDPSAEAIELGRKFYGAIWLAGGRQMTYDATRDNAGKVPFKLYICSFGFLYCIFTYSACFL